MIPKRLFLVLSVAVASFGFSAGVAGASTKPLIVSGVSEWGALAYQLVGADAKVVSLLTDPTPIRTSTRRRSGRGERGPGVGRPGERRRLRHVARTVGERPGSKAAVINVGKLMNVASGKNPHLFYNPLAASNS